MIPWRIELLGGLRATRGAVVVERFRTRKTGALLGFLAYQNRSQARETLIEEIWPDCAPETGRNNLRIALSSLRHTLEVEPDERGIFVRADRSLAALINVETDVGELESLLRQAATAPERLPILERALELYRGPLLSGFYEDWIPVAALRLESLAGAALETLIGDLQAQGEDARALEWAHRGAVAGLDAGKIYIERLQNARADKPQSVTPIISAPPLFLSRFFGRETELERIEAQLRAPESWLLTLVGPGGVGKTRVLCEALARQGESAAVWIALEGLSDAARLDEALVAALGIEVPVARAPLDCAARVLDGQTLCFDNFEHLLPAAARWLHELKQRVPALRCMVTSRRRLELDGETCLEIGALELPASDAPDEIAQSAAAALFLDRTRAVNANFSLLNLDGAQLARLLRQLDGLPLALELAAARSGILSLAQMLQRLQRDADLPPLSAQGTPRHHSLGATLNWSLGLLRPEEREFLARGCVFRAPFDVGAARAVAAQNLSEDEVLQFIQSARDASLLRAVPAQSGADEQRFALLETVRMGAWRTLDAQTKATTARLHALYCLDLALRTETTIGSSQDWHLPLEAAWLDLSAALDWAARTGEAAIGLDLASALWLFWRLGGRVREGRTHLEKLLALPDLPAGQVNDRLRARAATVAGFLALQISDYRAAEKSLERAVEAARGHAENGDVLAWALNLRGTTAQRQGDLGAACAYFRESLELYRAAPPHQRAVSLSALAGALMANGELDEARLFCRDARALWRNLDDAPGCAWIEEIEGRAALKAGDLVGARAHLETSLQLRRDAGAHTAAIAALDALGELELREARFEPARAHFQAALKAARALELRTEIASALSGLGAATRALGEPENARLYWQEALVLWRDIGDNSRAQTCHEALKALRQSS